MMVNLCTVLCAIGVALTFVINTDGVSMDRCTVEYLQRSGCGIRDVNITETECLERGCCYDNVDPDSPFICWMPVQALEIGIYGATNDAKRCHFPFKYLGQIYTTCETVDLGDAWCSVTYDYDNDQEMGMCKSPTCKMTQVGFEYTGDEDFHQSNYECQFWTSQSPNDHSYTSVDQYPDDAIADASNHCRNPSRESAGPWCYERYYRGWRDTCFIPMCSALNNFCASRIMTDNEGNQDFTASSEGNDTISSDAALPYGFVWCPLTANDTEWIEVDLSESYQIWAIVVKGGLEAWVETFSIQTKAFGYDHIDYEEEGTIKVFNGNVDDLDEAAIMFGPVIARYFRIIPLSWNSWPCLSVDLVGCPKDDFCLPDPCLNGAICDSIAMECVCLGGFDGVECENNIDDCADMPCLNGASCTDLIMDYECNCLTGYAGDNCEEGSAYSCNQLASDGVNSSGLFNLSLYSDITGTGCYMREYPKVTFDTSMTPIASVSVGSFDECWNECMAEPSCIAASASGYDNACQFYINIVQNVQFISGLGYMTAYKQCPGYVLAHCDFTDPLSPVTTIKQNQIAVRHSISYECAGCGTMLLNYGDISYKQLEELKKDSQYCEQDFMQICRYVDSSYNSLHLLDGSDHKIKDPSKQGCNCITGVCVTDSTCACNNGYQYKTDSATLTLDGLPVIYYTYGDTGSSYESLNITIGDLKCTGSSVELDECASDPCQHNGTCSDYKYFYTCNCPDGYTGDDCEIDIDYCADAPCQNGGTCTDGLNSYLCDCVAGYEGDDCETDINECTSSPCAGQSSCVNLEDMFTCLCYQGFAGELCNIDLNECSSAPCINGDCTDEPGFFTCTCSPGFTGPTCEIDFDECGSDPCQNDGLCIDMLNGYGCECPLGYEGDICEYDINECQSGPCWNDGICADRVNHFNCTCAPGYHGDQCEFEILECASNPCLNGAECADEINGYTCECASGYEGVHCDEEIDLCLSEPCLNGGYCARAGTGPSIYCRCMNGFEGLFCEINIDECASTPCLNSGECEDQDNKYYCFCMGEYSGFNCQYVKIDGEWGGWGPFSDCTNPCGPGVQIKKRACSNPPPQHGGAECIGDYTEVQQCIGEVCTDTDGMWGPWESWSKCDRTCNTGTKHRMRKCNNPPPRGSGINCVGDITEDFAPCKLRQCGQAVDGEWSQWSGWSDCDKDCGFGLVARTRACDNPPPVYGGQQCGGDALMMKTCMLKKCVDYDNCDAWAKWSECSTTCGDGQRRRQQTCKPSVQSTKGGDTKTNMTTIVETVAGDGPESKIQYEYEHCEKKQCGVMECYHCNHTYQNSVKDLTCKGPTKPCRDNQVCMYTFDSMTSPKGLQKGCVSKDICAKNLSKKCKNAQDQTISAITSYDPSIKGSLQPMLDTLLQIWEDIKGEVCVICCKSSRCNRGILPAGNTLFNAAPKTAMLHWTIGVAALFTATRNMW